MSVTITQGDYIYYQDTSVGSPTSRQWYFPGGTPTGATATNPLIRYLSPSTPGFDSTLTAIKSIPGGINLTSIKTEPNIIKVDPENLTVSLSATPSTVRMSQQVYYGASGPTGNVDYYAWSLAGTAGFTGLTGNSTLTVSNWLTLTGSELGATYSTYTATSSVTVNSILSNTATSSINVTYSKNGPVENYNYLEEAYTPNTAYYSTQTVGGGSVLTSNPSILLTGAGYIFNIDTSSSSPINNQFFRAHGELLTYRSASMDFQYSSQYGYIPGQLITASSALNACGMSSPSLTRYTLGNYMLPGDIADYFFNIFNFADVLSITKDLGSTNYWSTGDIESIIFDNFSVASQSSRSLEIGGINLMWPVAYKEFLTGGYTTGSGKGGVCLPSSAYAVGNPEVHIFLNIEYSLAGDINTINSSWTHQIDVPISMGGSVGNSPNGELVMAQDTAYGTMTGIATLINNELTTSGYSGYISASASPSYAWARGKNGSEYNPNEFQGLNISILDRGPTGPSGPAYITRIRITDNGPWPLPGNPGNTYPAAGLTGGGVVNWLGFYNDYIANPWQVTNPADPQPRRGWYFGTP